MVQLERNIDYLKWEALEMTKNQKFPHQAAQKLKEILADETIKPEDFMRELNNVFLSTQTLRWKSFVFFSSLKDRFVDHLVNLPWGGIFFCLFFIGFCSFLNKKYNLSKRLKLKKGKKIFDAIVGNLVERLGALLAYFVPTVVICFNYAVVLLPNYPFINLFLIDSIRQGITIYSTHPRLYSYLYFFIIVFITIRFKKPKPRFIRFHIVRGLMLIAFQGVPDMFFRFLHFTGILSSDQYLTTSLCLFVLNLFWLLPGIFHAITHTYPRSHLIRDAVEIHLGRDKDEGFKWWDRK